MDQDNSSWNNLDKTLQELGEALEELALTETVKTTDDPLDAEEYIGKRLGD